MAAVHPGHPIRQINLYRSLPGGKMRLSSPDWPDIRFRTSLEPKPIQKFTIEYGRGVVDDLASLRAHDRRRLLDQIEEQLTHQPQVQTRNKKVIIGLIPPWQHEEPVWELRVRQFRVFYDVNETEARVTVRAIRHKPPHKTTEEIL